MKELSPNELYELYEDTLHQCGSHIFNYPDDVIEMMVFEDFNIGATSFLHDDSLNSFALALLVFIALSLLVFVVLLLLVFDAAKIQIFSNITSFTLTIAMLEIEKLPLGASFRISSCPANSQP